MLHHAIAHGPKETIRFLLEKHQQIGFSVEERTNKGSTILHIACAYRDIEIIDLICNALVEIKSDINLDTQAFDGLLPINYACKIMFGINNLDTAINLLTRYPQKIYDLDNNGWSVMHYACKYGHFKVIEYLFGLVGNPNHTIDFNIATPTGSTPLQFASSHGWYTIVKFLLEKSKETGLDLTKKNNSNKTAQDLARDNGHQYIVDLFETHWELTQDGAMPNQPVFKT